METTLPARFAQLRLRDLTLLAHIHELGSLTEVAARLHVTQSAITQALQSLEAAFGHPLVERGRRGQRGVRLTASGEAALVHVRIARHELDAALEAAADPAAPELRVGALPLALVQPMPRAIASLRRRMPSLRLQLVEDTVPGLWARFEKGELDAIVCRLPALSEHPHLPEGVSHRTIAEETVVLVCSDRHPIARRRKLALPTLLEYEWVLPPEGSYTRIAIDQLFMRAGLEPPRAAITSMSFHSNLRLAAECNLLAVVPRSAARVARRTLGLVVLAVDWGCDDTAVSLVWREASLANPAMAAFVGSFR